jgi:hypothetical protein
MRRLGSAALVIFAASIGPLRADEAWACTYAAPIDGSPTLIRYRITGNDFIESNLKERFRILQNNQNGLVATSSIAEIAPDQDRPTVGATTLIIDKRTGAFLLSSENAGPTGIMRMPVRGTCLKDQGKIAPRVGR